MPTSVAHRELLDSQREYSHTTHSRMHRTHPWSCVVGGLESSKRRPVERQQAIRTRLRLAPRQLEPYAVVRITPVAPSTSPIASIASQFIVNFFPAINCQLRWYKFAISKQHRWKCCRLDSNQTFCNRADHGRNCGWPKNCQLPNQLSVYTSH